MITPKTIARAEAGLRRQERIARAATDRLHAGHVGPFGRARLQYVRDLALDKAALAREGLAKLRRQAAREAAALERDYALRDACRRLEANRHDVDALAVVEEYGDRRLQGRVRHYLGGRRIRGPLFLRRLPPREVTPD